MKTFKTITEQNIKYSTDNNTLYIDRVIKEAYYNHVNGDLEDAYCKLLDALVEYSKLFTALTLQQTKIDDIENEVGLSTFKRLQNIDLRKKLRQLNQTKQNLLERENITKETLAEIKNISKQIKAIESEFFNNINFIDNAPTDAALLKEKKLKLNLIERIAATKGLIERIINNYLSENKEPLCSSNSGIIRTDITKNLPKESLYKRVELSNLVVAYAELIESLCPKLIKIGTSIIKGVYNEIPYEEIKMLNIINTLSYEYLSYLQRAILMFKTNNFSINGELENKIMLLEIVKEYMKNDHFDEEKVKLTSTYYKNRFGITPQVACDIYVLARAKKEN